MRNRTLMAVLAIVLVVGLASATFAAATSGKKTEKKFDQKAVLMDMWKAPDSTVVGSVNGAPITKGELVKTMWFWNAPTQLQDLLNQKMIEQAAQKAKATITASELQDKIKESLSRMGASDVNQLLDQIRITYYRFIAGTKLSALAEKTVQKNLVISDSDLAQWIKARHILISCAKDEKDQVKIDAAKAKSDEVYLKIKAGEDFAKLADEYSEDPGNNRDGKKSGGDLGWFTNGSMVPEFEKAAFALKAGDFSEPVKSDFGYHIIKVEKLGKDATPAEKADLKKKIMESKIPMEMNRWYTELQSKTKFDNLLMGPQPKQPTPVMPPRPKMRPKQAEETPPPAPPQ